MTDEGTAHEPPHRQEVRFHHGDVALAGALYTPATAGPHPAMIMIQGSGPADRDNFAYFPPIRAHVVHHGIAVLCFDKPGTGGSSGDWRAQSLQDRADEALAAVGFLRSQDDIDPGRVGLWGFSQGGWVTPLAASLSRDVAFIIPVSGPGVSPAEQNAYDIAHNMRADGLPEEQVACGVAYVEALMDAARRKDSYERLDTPCCARRAPRRGTGTSRSQTRRSGTSFCGATPTTTRSWPWNACAARCSRSSGSATGSCPPARAPRFSSGRCGEGATPTSRSGCSRRPLMALRSRTRRD